jgi:hypothetical protein
VDKITPEQITKLDNIPKELREPPLWVKYQLVYDPEKPGKKPRKRPLVAWSQRANLRSLDPLLGNSAPANGVQRFVDKAEGFAYIDVDHVIDIDPASPTFGETQPWATELISWMDTYTETSASGGGFHLVCRGTVPKDYHVAHRPVEIYAGKSRKLIAMTGDIHGWEYGGIESRQEKLNELYRKCVGGLSFGPTYGKTNEPGETGPPPCWRNVFHTGSELDSASSRALIKGILEEGNTWFGSLSGVGKTWIGLSIAHALLSGEKLFGFFPVLQKSPVLYLVPEMGNRRFRERLLKMRISMDGGFFCQTVRDGAIDLTDPMLLQAVVDMKPVVILDTAIRFQTGSENTSTDQAQSLGANIFKLISAGAGAVVCMHHRKKDAGGMEPTLENALRGTGDFGAMADCVWAVEHATGDFNLEESRKFTRLRLTCVKPRDMEPADPFVIQGRPYIDEIGDFRVLDKSGIAAPVESKKDGDEKVLELIAENPKISRAKIKEQTGFGFDKIARIVKHAKLKQENGVWIRTTPPEEVDSAV